LSPATHIYTLPLHDALPISDAAQAVPGPVALLQSRQEEGPRGAEALSRGLGRAQRRRLIQRTNHQKKRPSARSHRRPLTVAQTPDRKSTRLNSSHVKSSYAV